MAVCRRSNDGHLERGSALAGVGRLKERHALSVGQRRTGRGGRAVNGREAHLSWIGRPY